MGSGKLVYQDLNFIHCFSRCIQENTPILEELVELRKKVQSAGIIIIIIIIIIIMVNKCNLYYFKIHTPCYIPQLQDSMLQIVAYINNEM